MIDLPSRQMVHLEDYFLKWERISNSSGWDKAVYTSGGIGLAGLIFGASVHLAAAQAGALTTALTWAAGPPIWMAMGPFALFLVPVGLLGAIALIKVKDTERAKRLKEISDQLTEGVSDQKNALVDHIAENRDQNVPKICDDVAHEIKTTYNQKLQELEKISTMVDATMVFETLRRDVDTLRVKVNP